MFNICILRNYVICLIDIFVVFASPADMTFYHYVIIIIKLFNK